MNDLEFRLDAYRIAESLAVAQIANERRRIRELEAAINAALAEDHGDAEVYAEVVPKILRRALTVPNPEGNANG